MEKIEVDINYLFRVCRSIAEVRELCKDNDGDIVTIHDLKVIKKVLDDLLVHKSFIKLEERLDGTRRDILFRKVIVDEN